MKVSKELQELTDKFIKEFNDLAFAQDKKEHGKKTERDDLYYFHYYLTQAIADSTVVPQYKESNYSCLMGMSEFDSNVSKAMFQNRIQGFVSCIEKRITKKSLKEQEDYLVENVVKEKYDKEEDDFNWDYKDGKMVNFTVGKKLVKAEKITFDVQNTRNLFEGKVVLYKKMKPHFKNENDFVEKMTTDEVYFYNKSGEQIMRISLNFDGNEEGDFTHFKHIADINSFYMILKYT
jgi:hypothetical protein